MVAMHRAVVVAALTLAAHMIGAAPVRAQAQGDSRRGRQVYERYCVQCHGDRGDGAGEVAPWTQPKPRDFRQGIFKFTTTPFGFLPTTADLDRVIQDGLYGTLMPPFNSLSARERRDVIAYVQTLSPRWRTEQPGSPVVVTAEPTPTRESVTQGRALFEANCAKCHGDGSGNGPSARKGEMVDDWGEPVPPSNLTRGPRKVGKLGPRHLPPRDGRDQRHPDARARRVADAGANVAGRALHPGPRRLARLDARAEGVRRANCRRRSHLGELTRLINRSRFVVGGHGSRRPFYRALSPHAGLYANDCLRRLIGCSPAAPPQCKTSSRFARWSTGFPPSLRS